MVKKNQKGLFKERHMITDSLKLFGLISLHTYFESYLSLGYTMPDIRIHKQNQVNAKIIYLDVFSSDAKADLYITLFWQVNYNDRCSALHVVMLVCLTLVLSYS